MSYIGQEPGQGQAERYIYGAQGQSGGGFTNRAAANGADTGSTGGGGSHGHGSIDMNVKYIDMIVASKD